jgi:hypothetical protein
MKKRPLQKIKAGGGNLGYPVERTSFWAGVHPQKSSAFPGALFRQLAGGGGGGIVLGGIRPPN